MRIGDIFAPARRFVARVSAFVDTGDDRLGRPPFHSGFRVPFGATPPKLHPPTPTPSSEASVALTPSGLIFTLTRRRTAAAAGAEQPAVDHSFGSGRVPWSLSSRVDHPPHVLRPRPPLAVAPGPPRAPAPFPTVRISSDRDRAEALRALLLLTLDPFGTSFRFYGRFGRP